VEGYFAEVYNTANYYSDMEGYFAEAYNTAETGDRYNAPRHFCSYRILHVNVIFTFNSYSCSMEGGTQIILFI
jgi:hypothetical protein